MTPAGRVLGYIVAPQPSPGTLAEYGEPGDIVLAVCEVTP